MKKKTRFFWAILALFFAITLLAAPQHAAAASAAKIDDEVALGLKHLYASTPAAKTLSKDARSLATTTTGDQIYAFFFDQGRVMAGLGLQGSKITRITPDK